MTAPKTTPTIDPKPPDRITPPTTEAAIASSSFRFPFAASAVFVSNTWVAAKMVAQNAVNMNSETFS